MSSLRCLLLVLGALLVHAPHAPHAQEAEEPAPPPADPAPPPPAEADRRAGGGGGDVFIPSEEIQADQEVTFPVDI